MYQTHFGRTYLGMSLSLKLIPTYVQSLRLNHLWDHSKWHDYGMHIPSQIEFSLIIIYDYIEHHHITAPTDYSGRSLWYAGVSPKGPVGSCVPTNLAALYFLVRSDAHHSQSQARISSSSLESPSEKLHCPSTSCSSLTSHSALYLLLTFANKSIGNWSSTAFLELSSNSVASRSQSLFSLPYRVSLAGHPIK